MRIELMRFFLSLIFCFLLSGCSHINQILIFKFKADAKNSDLDIVRREFASGFRDVPLDDQAILFLNKHFGMDTLLKSHCSIGRSTFFPAKFETPWDPTAAPHFTDYNLRDQIFVVCESNGEVGIASNYDNWASKDPEVLTNSPNNKERFFRHDKLMQELKKMLGRKGLKVESYTKIHREMDDENLAW